MKRQIEMTKNVNFLLERLTCECAGSALTGFTGAGFETIL